LPIRTRRATIGEKAKEGRGMENGLIYCVDDDEDILLLYRVILQAAGHTVETVASGEQALTLILKRQPDLVILDERLNAISGLAVCARIREQRPEPYLPVIMVTAVDSREGKIRSLEKGVDDYMVKPFDEEELLAKVQVMLRIRRLNSELLHARQRLLQAEKLAVIGQLATTMAHEIRNPLSILYAQAQLLQGKVPVPGETQETLNQMLKKISEIDHIIRELLQVAQPPRITVQSMDLVQMLEEVCTYVRGKCLRQGIRLRTAFGENLPWVRGDGEQLPRALLEVLLQAMRRVPSGGDLAITTCRVPDPDRIAVRVSCSGAPLSRAEREQLFAPLFGKSSEQRMTGLYHAKVVLEELGGHIEVQSPGPSGVHYCLCLLPQRT